LWFQVIFFHYLIELNFSANPLAENGLQKTAIPVTSLKVGDEVMLRVQGGARHTGIEIQEFIVEN
jgi:3-dehydroquinate synthase class II